MATPSLEQNTDTRGGDITPTYPATPSSKYLPNTANSSYNEVPAPINQFPGNPITSTVIPELVPTAKELAVAEATERKQIQAFGYSSIEQFDKFNPSANRNERMLVLANIITKNNVADASRDLSQIAGDTAANIGTGLVTSTAGLATGAAVALTSPNIADKAKEGEDQEVLDILAKSKGTNILEGFQENAINASKKVSELVNDIGEALHSTQFKAQGERYQRASEEYKLTPEYLSASPNEKIFMDASNTVSNLFNNPLLAEGDIVQTAADIATSIATGSIASKVATKSALNTASKEVLTDTPIATKRIEDALEGKTGAKAATGAVTIQGAATEAGSTANEIVTAIDKLSHTELMEGERYPDFYNKAVGTHEEKVRQAKYDVTSLAAEKGYIATGISSALIGRVTGADAALGGIATKGVTSGLKAKGSAIAKETLEEGIQNPVAEVSKNIALSDVKPDQDLREGIGEAAVRGVTGGLGASTATQVGSTLAPAAIGTTKLAIGAAKLTGKAAIGTGKLAVGIYKIPSNIRELRERKAKAAPITSPDAVKEAPISVTPVNDAAVKTQEIVEPINNIVTESEGITSIKQAATDLQGMAKQINDAVVALPEGEQNLGELLKMAGTTAAIRDDFYSKALEVMNAPETSDEDKAIIDSVLTEIDFPKTDSIEAAVAKEIQLNPSLTEAMNKAFKAYVTDDVTELNEVLTSIDEEGKTAEITKGLTEALLNTVLYSVDLISDDSISSDNLRKAAKATSGDVSKRYEDLATIKDMDTVAFDVVQGDKEFIGVNTHMARLKKAIGKNNKTVANKVLDRLTNFAKQRTEKVNALTRAISEFDGTKPITANWGKEGTWTITMPKAGTPVERTSLARTEALLTKVREEETIVLNAVRAANSIINGITEDAPTEEEVVTASPTEKGEIVTELPPINVFEDLVVPQIQDLVKPSKPKELSTEETAERTEAVNASTEMLDLQLTELVQYRKLRENTILAQKGIIERISTPSAKEQLKVDEAALRAIDSEIATLTNLIGLTQERAGAEFDAGLVTTPGSDSADTVANHLNKLSGNLLGSIADKATINLIEEEYATNISTPKQVRGFLRDKTIDELEGIIGFITNMNLVKADRAVVTKLLGASKSIATAPDVLKETIAALKENFTGAKDTSLDRTNRFRNDVVTYRASKLWEDVDYLSAMPSINTLTDLAELGLDTSKLNEHDLDTVKGVATKRSKFYADMSLLNRQLLINLNKAKVNTYDQNKLRFLLDDKGRFLPKIVDAAFLAYNNTTNTVGESVYNDSRALMRMLGLSDTSQLDNIQDLDKLTVLGAPISAAMLADSFKQALGWQHDASTPASVYDSVYSAMGGVMASILKKDDDFHNATEIVEGIGSMTGYVLNTPTTSELFNRVHEGNTKRSSFPSKEEGANFTYHKNKGKGVLSQISEPIDNTPSNWVGAKPPKATASNIRIRDNSPATDVEVQAENISREVAHVLEPTVLSFHRALGSTKEARLDAFKKLKGYVENTSLLNAEHKLKVDGVNQEIVTTFETAEELIEEVDAADNKDIYFTGKFSSVRRQQREGEVNDQANLYHRILIGLKNNTKIKSINLNKLNTLTKGTAGYNLVLALAQSYGLDVDKQGNTQTVKRGYMDGDTFVPSMVASLIEIINTDSLEADLASRMVKGEFVEGAFDGGILEALQGMSAHKLQGVFTVAKLISLQDSTGTIKNFEHYLKVELDGLTNGPAHSTIMAGLAGLSSAEVEERLHRFGYLVGNAIGDNTHEHIGKGQLIDAYKVVAATATDNLDVFVRSLIDKPSKENTELLNAYTFLSDKGVDIAPISDKEGKLVGVTVTRAGTKNPVTVTVYGGGHVGIHRKMSSAMREIFAEELSSISNELTKGASSKYQKPSILIQEIEEWDKALLGNKKGIYLSKQLKSLKTKGHEDYAEAIRQFRFNDEYKEVNTKQIATLYGAAVTGAIDTVFKENKRTAALMNTSINFVTAMANSTYGQLYTALAEKRFEEGKLKGSKLPNGSIKVYDTLSTADVGLVQRKLKELFPYVTTSIGDSTNVATTTTDRVTDDIGVREVRYPVLDGKESTTKIRHSSTQLGLPGVRAIPVLTISIDGSTQIYNHLLQGRQGNFLNVFDAIDRIPDANLRASNELFNVAEYMSLMNTDTLKALLDATTSAFKAQTQLIELEGMEIKPVLAQIDFGDTEANINLPQELLRQATKELTLPIATGLDVSSSNAGNTKEFLLYLIEQLAADSHNNKLARDRFMFGNPTVSINQMAGVDNGHAIVASGQVILTDEAKALLDEDGKKLLDTFNEHMSVRHKAYMKGVEEGTLRSVANTNIEELRRTLIATFDEDEAEAAELEINNILSPLLGLWQDLRGTFDLNKNTFVYKMSGKNGQLFKEALDPTLDKYSPANTVTGVRSPISTVGSVLSKTLPGYDKGTNKGALDNILSSLEVHVTPNLEAKGTYETVQRAGKPVHIITIREGITTEEANTVLAHELIHALTQGGILKGIQDRKNKKASIEAVYVTDLWKQLSRMLKYYETNTIDIPESLAVIQRLINKGDNTKAVLEYVAYIGSENIGYGGFLKEEVSVTELSPSLLKLIKRSWTTIKKYLGNMLNWHDESIVYAGSIEEQFRKGTIAEYDVLAHLISRLGSSGLVNYKAPLNSEDIQATSMHPNPIAASLRKVESAANEVLYKGVNMAMEASLRALAKAGNIHGAQDTITDFFSATPEFRENAIKLAVDKALTNKNEGERTGVIRSTFGEFFSRNTQRSQTLDEHNDIAKHEADSMRETTKEVIGDAIEENLGNITDEQNRAILDTVIRGDIYALTEDTNQLIDLLSNDALVTERMGSITAQIMKLTNVDQKQKNLMVNEATALGARAITGGAYLGLNLPNAKAIVKMVGSGLPSVEDEKGSIEKLVDDLATLSSIKTLDASTKKLAVQVMTSNPEGTKYVYNVHRSTIDKIEKAYGKGKLLGLAKGYIPDQRNPNRAIKVVPWEERNKYRGYTFVREFTHETVASRSDDKKALLVSKEGGTVPWVQGAMSTIESAVGGFSVIRGAAVDKALPFITDDSRSRKWAEFLYAKRIKLKEAKVFVERLRAPKQLPEGILPNVNGLGMVTGYRYVLSHAEREELLDTSHEVADVVSSYAASLGEQIIAEKFNKELVDKLVAAFEDDTLTPEDRNENFIKIHANSKEPKLAEMWRIIPEHTKEKLIKGFGGNFIYVHKRDLDNALGYREWSISTLWNTNAEPGSKREMFIDIAEAILGGDAVNKLRYAERVLQEGVVAAKDIIVVKSIVVPVANAFSNVFHLLVLGVDPVTIAQQYRESGEGLRDMKRDVRALMKAELEQTHKGTDNSEEISLLKERIENNPVKFMFDAGLVSTIIEDTTKVNTRGSVRQSLIDNLIPTDIKEADNMFLDVGKNIIMTQDSWIYDKLSFGLELGDFGAKYILYKKLVAEGVEHNTALDTVRVEFVNYNTLSNMQLDYANKVGGVFFFKYFARIQSIILKTIKDNPTRALTSWIGADTIGLPSIFEAMVLDKDITNTTGAFDLLHMAGSAHPLGI